MRLTIEDLTLLNGARLTLMPVDGVAQSVVDM